MSSIALGPASLPGPGDELVPTSATSDQAPVKSDLSTAEPSPTTGRPEPPPPERIPRWLVRMELFLRVMLQMYIGLFVCYMPWWHGFWDQNPIFLQYPAVGAIALNGAVRGLVSGLGLLNLWIAFQDALRRGRD